MTNSQLLPHLTDDTSAESSVLARSTLISRNVTIHNRRTSVRLEPEMWNGLREICRREHTSMHKLCTSISLQKPLLTSLTAAIRVFIMSYFRSAATEDGHIKAGHGPGGHFMLSQNNVVHLSHQSTASVDSPYATKPRSCG